MNKLTLQSHNESTTALDHLGDHVIDETVLVPNALGLKVLLVLLLVDLLEDVLEAAIILLQDGVLGAHVQRETLRESHLERGVSEASDGFIGVVLGLRDTTAGEVEDLDGLGLTASGGVDELEGSRSRDHTVCSTVLVTEGVTTNDNGLGPSRHKARNARDDNGFTEDRSTAAEGVSDMTSNHFGEGRHTGCFG